MVYFSSPKGDRFEGSTNATWLRRSLTLFLVSILKRLRQHSGRVLFLSRRYCVKYGKSLHLSEAAAMKLVAEHTTIPIPKIICAFERKGFTYIVMEAIQGEVIANGWQNRDEQSKTKLLKELRDYVSQLRAIPHPRPGMVAAANLSKMVDFRIPAGRVGFGPFVNSEEFHSFLREGLSGDGISGDLKRLVLMHQAREYPTYFTHGDLSPLNILVRGEHIVGIIDWEMAGWLPDYWEYTSAINVHPFWAFWRDEVGRFLRPYEEEVEMEALRRQYFGDT